MENTYGIVFDIQRSSMHDGPGIRTTIFLKGCPLNCKWCHNPESQKKEPQLAFLKEKCIGCRRCEVVCESRAHKIRDNHTFERSLCTACGKCADVCSTQAIKLYGYKISAEDIVNIALKDKQYYLQTGGGITVSGGEPFLQKDFTFAILTLAKKQGIHTCIETSGYTSSKVILESLKYVDCYLFDFKLDDDALHKQFTGVSNEIIKSNFKLLYESGAKIWLRCPIIPNINDTCEHFAAIAKMEQNYPKLEGIEILPYHNLGKSKAEALDLLYEISAPTADIEIKQKWKDMMKREGCSKKIIETF